MGWTSSVFWLNIQQKTASERGSITLPWQRKSLLFSGFNRKLLKCLIPLLYQWMYIETGNRVKVDTGGRQEFKTVYHSVGNKTISFLAAVCQFNEAWCWPSSLFIASLSLRFSMSNFLTLSVSIFLSVPSFRLCLGLPIVRGAISVVNDWVLFHERFFVFCFSIQTSSLTPAPSLNPDAQRKEKIPEMHFHVPLGMSTIQFHSNRCHISTSLWGSHATREKGRKTGRGGTKEWSGRLLKGSRLKVRPHMLQCEHTHKHTQWDWNNDEDVVTTPLCNLTTTCISSSSSYPPQLCTPLPPPPLHPSHCLQTFCGKQ